MRKVQAHYNMRKAINDYKDLQYGFAVDFLLGIDFDKISQAERHDIENILENEIEPIARKITSSDWYYDYDEDEMIEMMEKCDDLCIEIIKDYIVPNVDESDIFNAISDSQDAWVEGYLLYLYSYAIGAFRREVDELEQRYNDYKEKL